MKLKLHKTLAVLPLAAACATFGASVQAQQVPAVIKFEGKVAKITCTAKIAGGDTVTLPLIQESDIAGVGDFGGEKDFTVEVKSCGKNPGIFAKAYFYNTTANAVDDGRLTLAPGSSGEGWQYQLLPAGQTTQLDVGTQATVAPNNDNTTGGDLASGGANLQYKVRYYRSAVALTAGTGKAQATYVLYFQ